MQFILALVAAFLVSFILLPVIIKVSRSIDLLDTPDKRKIHNISTPSLGGIGIFIGIFVALALALPLHELAHLKFFISSLFIIFLLGIRDDISSLIPKHKLFTQIFAAFVVVYFSNIQLVGFYGIFGINEIPDWLGITISVFVIVTLTNSFNLIDGIDGLAGSVALLILSFFSYVFVINGEIGFAVISFATLGALVAFLVYNWHPSKLFMGDTGSMVLGFILSVLAIDFINSAQGLQLINGFRIQSTVGVVVALLILPIFDTLRVFVIRFLQGRSPLDPDRNHLHHGLLKLGFSHSSSTLILITFNILIAGIALYLNKYLSNGILLLTVLLLAVAFTSVLEYYLSKKRFLGKSKGLDVKIIYRRKSA